MPLAVAVLVCGAIGLTLMLRLPQITAFRHAIDVIRGKYNRESDSGEVTSFQALTAALSGTVGLGNIGGVAIAIGTGGPGAAFWLVVAGFLGMASKMTECTLAQLYREIRPDGRVMGGGMYYLSRGFAEHGYPRLGRALAVWFSVACIAASFGGGNSFQVSQSVQAVGAMSPLIASQPWIYGLGMAALVAVVILGGIRRIASVAERLVPAMCGTYLLMALCVLVLRADAIPDALVRIVTEAFEPRAAYGGFVGVLVIGFRRAAFSNEAGFGSSAVAHAAAKTPYPAREGIVALLEPFIDTIVVCSTTALMLVVTGAGEDPHLTGFVSRNEGAALTSSALGSVSSLFPYVLALTTVLFAFSTIVSWSYYGERCWAYLFGDRSSLPYRVVFVVVAFLGSVVTATNVLEFGDLVIFAMVFPNMFGIVVLRGEVSRAFTVYMARLRSGEIAPTAQVEYRVNRPRG